MDAEVLAFIAGLAALISTRLIELLKIPVRRVLPGKTEQAEEARKAVIQGLALVVSGLVVFAVSAAANWMIATFGETMFKVVAGGILSSEGLHLIKSRWPKNQEILIEVEEPKVLSGSRTADC
jgi:hypothetical protein